MPKFIPPTQGEVADYFVQSFRALWKENNRVIRDEPAMLAMAKNWAAKFWNYYDSVDWFVGKKKMVRWRGAAAGWFTRAIENGELKGYRHSKGRTDRAPITRDHVLDALSND